MRTQEGYLKLGAVQIFEIGIFLHLNQLEFAKGALVVGFKLDPKESPGSGIHKPIAPDRRVGLRVGRRKLDCGRWRRKAESDNIIFVT